MAKRQNFIVGSDNVVTESLTPTQLNEAFDRNEILTADKLDGVFNAVSDYSNDSSNEIANAIQSITGSQPTGESQTELADALQQMRNEILTSSLTFKGYVATSAPSASTYELQLDNLWINAASMPTSFPIAASSIKKWDGSAWVNYGSTYTPNDFEAFRNLNDGQGYYWFGGQWVVMSTDLSTYYFYLNSVSGKWEIKSNVNLPGTPSVGTSPTYTAANNKIATVSTVKDFRNILISNCITKVPQHINISINASNQLELASGSTVYLGGSTAVPISTTIKQTATTLNTGKYFVTTNPAGTAIEVAGFSSAVSAASNPGTAYLMWFNTTDGKPYINGSDGTAREISMPIAIASYTNGTGWTKVEQVFNGMGYLGGTVFVLPGLEYLIPNGRNSDGSLNNTVVSLTYEHHWTGTSGANGNVYVSINQSGTVAFDYVSLWKIQDEEPAGVQYLMWYSPRLNKTWQYMNGEWQSRQRCLIALIHETGGKVDSLQPKYAFRAVDYNDYADATSRISTLETADTQNVKLTGNQTISGTKTFAARPEITGTGLVIKNMTLGQAKQIVFQPSDTTYEGALGHVLLSSGVAYTYLHASHNATIAELGVYVSSSGTKYTKCPASDANSSIVTTIDKLKGSTNRGYFKLGNGLIVQWLNEYKTTQEAIFTLPTAFSSVTSYTVVATKTDDSDDAFPVLAKNMSASTIRLARHSGMGGGMVYNIIAIGY